MHEAIGRDPHHHEVGMVLVTTMIVVVPLVDGVLEVTGNVPLDVALQWMTITIDMADEPHRPVTTVRHPEDMTLTLTILEDRHHLR